MNTSTLDRLAGALFGALLAGQPTRAALMCAPGGDRKYSDAPKGYTFTPADILDHLTGARTWAITLGNADGVSLFGMRDYDGPNGEGARKGLEALKAARAAGLRSAAILINGRAHVLFRYAKPAPNADIYHQIDTICPDSDGEIYPSGNPIRFPGGLHRWYNTRGVLVLDTGERFALDTELVEGLSAFLAMPANSAPPTAPETCRAKRGNTFGATHKPETWKRFTDKHKETGGRIWLSPRTKAAAATIRVNFAALLAGKRIVTMRDGKPDDSDSSQVVGLVYDAIGANYPEDEIRMMALWLKSTIAPDEEMPHYQAHIDYEIQRYRPRNYNPQPTLILGKLPGEETPKPLPPAEHKAEPKSRARHDRPQPTTGGAAGYLAWLTEQACNGVVLLSQAECAEALGCSVRTIKRYENALGDQVERQPFNGRQAGRLFVNVPSGRGDNIPETDRKCTALDVVTAEAAEPHSNAENAEAVAMHRGNTPAPMAPVPQAAPDPAPAGHVRPRGLLARLIAEALEAYHGAPTRKRLKLVRAYLEANAPDGCAWSNDEIKPAYRAELTRRQVVTFSPATLRAELRRTEARRDKQRAASDNGWRWSHWYAGLLAAELALRPPEPERAKRRRKLVEAVPDTRAAGQRYQAELWAALDRDRERQRGGQGGVLLSQKFEQANDGRAAEQAAQFVGTNRQYVSVAKKIAVEAPARDKPPAGVHSQPEGLQAEPVPVGPGTPASRQLIASLRARQTTPAAAPA